MEPKAEHDPPRQGLSVQKAAAIMGVCEQTVRDLFHRRELEGYTVGRKVLVFADSVAAYQAKNSNGAQQAPVPQPEQVHRTFVPPTSRSRRGVPVYDRHRRRSD